YPSHSLHVHTLHTSSFILHTFSLLLPLSLSFASSAVSHSCELSSRLNTHWWSTWTVSTRPTITVSMGRFLVSGVKRALDPWVMSTYSPSPAPTVSTATNVRPVVTSRLRSSGSSR